MTRIDSVLEYAPESGAIRVAMIGAGPLARVIALQVATDLPGIRLVAIADEDLDSARRVYAAAGAPVPRVIESPFGLRSAINAGEPAVTRNWRLLCESDQIDAVIEAVEAAEHCAEILRAASETGKHIIPTSIDSDDGLDIARKVPAGKVETALAEVDATNFFDIFPVEKTEASTTPRYGDAHGPPAGQV